LELELEQYIQECDTNEDKKRIINEKISNAKKVQENFISLFPISDVRNIGILDYVQGKPEGKRTTFSYLIEHGSRAFGTIGGGYAIKHGVYMNKDGEFEFNSDHFKSHTEAYDSTINVIADCLDHAKNFIKTKDWKIFSDHITELIESNKKTPGIPVISKIIAMYYPDEFIRMWSHSWLNATLDAFQIKRQDLPEGQTEGKFYEKMERLMIMKNSHPIMKEWPNEYFSYAIGQYIEGKSDTKKTKPKLLEFLKFEMIMKQNYQPIIIKMLLENPNHTITIQDIRKKFDELNFDRGNFVSSTGKPMGNSAIDVVKKSQVKKYVKFPEGTSDGSVTLIEKTYQESTRDECLKICGDKILQHHLDELMKKDNQYYFIQAGKGGKYLKEFKENNFVAVDYLDQDNPNGDFDLTGMSKDEIINKNGSDKDATELSHISQIKSGDIIAVVTGNLHVEEFAIATSNYYFQNLVKKNKHRVNVEYLNFGTTKIGKGTVKAIIQDKSNKIKNFLTDGEDLTSDEEQIDSMTMDNYDRALEWKPNLILYGPPGTGKTWMANKIAKKYLPGTFLERIIDELKERAEYSGYTFEKEGTRTNQNLYVLKREKEKVYEEIRVDFHIDNTDYFQVNSAIEFFKKNNVDGISGKNYLILVREKPELFLCLPYGVEQLYSKFVAEGNGTGGWDPTGEGKHSVHNLKINGTEAYFEPKDETSQTKYVSEFLNTWNPLDDEFDASNIGSNIFNVTFHPSYSYEDFVEGFRPNTKKGSNEQYVLEKGIFWKVCEIAKRHPKKKIILIIDEINRGNIPKILGELITLIEKDKRNPQNSLKLTYSKDSFFVPENLIIIGTMNTADKSLMQMDDALKRRFVFEELMPDTKLLENQLREENKVANASDYSNILKRINEKILGKGNEDEKERMKQFRDRQIGHSYFWNIGKEGNPDDDLQKIIKYDVIPLLQDYFYGDYTEIRKILSKKDNEKDVSIINSDNRPTNLVTDVSQKENLRNALTEI
jgi:MoxR-like ATPase